MNEFIYFKAGDKITSNGCNGFLIIDVNEYQYCCKDILTDDFVVFSKTEHKFRLFDVKEVLKSSLHEIIGETNISEHDKTHVYCEMVHRINKLL